MASTALATEVFRDPLAQRSLDVLRDGQARSGAFVAAPSFPVYGFGWLRDGAFCAQALDAIGERARVAAFHRWAADAIEGQRARVDAAVAAVGNGGGVIDASAMLPARFTLDGRTETDGDEPWPNFQIDGYGMWLWALGTHVGNGTIDPELAATVSLAARYLTAVWPVPCWGCWEEFDDGEHAATIAAVAAGLDAAARLLDEPEHAETAAMLRDHLVTRFAHDGRLKRCATDSRVDGSLLWIGAGYGVLERDDSRVRATVEAVRADLVGPGGGVYRYEGDTYYGGGQWILLTCSLGWHSALCGDAEGVELARDWVRRNARPNGDLPEQVTAHAQEPSMVEHWVARWGAVASPLLWSHAMYLLMQIAVEETS
jgi:isomaltose glucohydrolase